MAAYISSLVHSRLPATLSEEQKMSNMKKEIFLLRKIGVTCLEKIFIM